MPAKLVLMFNNSVVSEHFLNKDETTIGRRFANDIHIDNLGVSGSHAKILMFGNDAFIEDLNSTNGTFVNGSRVDKKPLQDNDIITVGKYQLRYENENNAQEDEFERTVILQAKSVAPEPPASTPATASARAKLVVATGTSKGKSMPLTKTVTRLGRPGSQTAAIAKRPQGYFFVNLGLEGVRTTLNGNVVTVGASLLKDGDKIAIGSIELSFQLD